MSADLRASAEFQAYERARAAVLEMKHAAAPAGGVTDPSAYWAEELDNIDYLIEATPLVVRKLRHHSFHVTGVRPYDYRHKDDGRRERFEARLNALRELGGDALRVPEPPAFGGFGFEIDGGLYNIDTLKFYEVLIGMKRGGVLDALARVERPVVCEIGAGWAGFAYQFKTLFPNTTYVIVDFPELFLFSATYLGGLFPGARMVFAGTAAAPGDEDVAAWANADFVFVPYQLAHLVSKLPLDLAINMVSFQEMTDGQVRGYAAMAAAAGCPLVYSLNRERSPYNTELVSVSEALAERYRLTEITVLGTDYTSAMKAPPKPGRVVQRSELSYRHLVGRLERPLAGARSTTADGTRSAGPPRVVLGMTLYNNARHLREAMRSLLAQSFPDFVLLLLDDASVDETERIARDYEASDPRVRYRRHESRQAMIATWREVAETAAREYPEATYFAWVSDHDIWHPRWLERMVRELDDDAGAVLAYPITRRMTQEGVELAKGPRLFDTAGLDDVQERWRHFCDAGVGAGDMVYGLMRTSALVSAGIFRPVLRPDRLLIAELTLRGRIRQVPEVLWFRRQSSGTSIERQRHTLVLEGQAPPGFWMPPWAQHTRALWHEYVSNPQPALPIERRDWLRMLLRYQLTYGWRHVRKTETSHAVGRGINATIRARKLTRHHYHHAVYDTLTGLRTARGRARRLLRRGVYEAAMLARRLGLRRDHTDQTETR